MHFSTWPESLAGDRELVGTGNKWNQINPQCADAVTETLGSGMTCLWSVGWALQSGTSNSGSPAVTLGAMSGHRVTVQGVGSVGVAGLGVVACAVLASHQSRARWDSGSAQHRCRLLCCGNVS